jgi:hypothetical protein
MNELFSENGFLDKAAECPDSVFISGGMYRSHRGTKVGDLESEVGRIGSRNIGVTG